METIASKLINAISKYAANRINLMEVCGTHTMVIAKSGIRSMLPENIIMLSGPGCPVCVTPQETIDYAIALSQEKKVIITTFGDMVRVPGTRGSLEAFSPRIVYSPLDALKVAHENPDKDIVFIGVGFETTSPTIAATVIAAREKKMGNFYVLPAFKMIPPALNFIAGSSKINVHGFILPGHVSTIIGSKPYKFLSDKYHLPGCITGFEPIDILQGILVLTKQVVEGTPTITIEYERVVKPEGNEKALELLNTVFGVCDARWRGIGLIPKSGLEFSRGFQQYDIRRKYDIKVSKSVEPKGCICGRVLLGLNMPFDCALFGKKCTPLTPVGPCMVSSEGSCAAYYKYGNYRKTRQGKAIRGTARQKPRKR
ncbi:hydrogenase assembly protein HupF [candidate division WOR_3 bacterium SM1_77]|uniref:Hydrogenase assembly protein HupF n=1 Tax=candidate division WOR_3 bacterium SM1_77 TaxID=1703778 RepID=A0A0S8JYS5_UNCW3|nr:MAG: hydrogenase assembly protein HupF [candidate division WOR_3 bacterium SM1_77]